MTEIIGQAKGIFELEVKPEIEKQLDVEISNFVKQGLTQEQISKKMKIPVARIKKAL